MDPPDDEHGVDLVLGGHDHFCKSFVNDASSGASYADILAFFALLLAPDYVGKGAASFEGEEFERNLPGVEKDEKTFVVKSGTDFHDLSEIELVLTDKAEGKVRARRIQSLNGAST